ncbi:NAD-dependent epimerase/dehydratase [Streptomyces sp. AK010]|uniref:NAD-dependent epimerase/dehydratase family protein n=1 Tax=Streptomyces sp. AK010 TaxID=2723074 RepID=UPI00181E03AF|nr:NAD-dependent epimerase/dehydratase [Streptomyces sp. AK010]MBB6421382.1 nucleoside-diphosphate-sugar epimerase [Streptomyces sp. AK010]
MARIPTDETAPGRSRDTGEAPVVTVLGASGFIGSVVTAALAARSTRVRAVARRPSPLPERNAHLVQVHTADLTDPAHLADAVAGSHAVVNLVLSSGGWRAADSAEGRRVNVGVLHDLLGVLGRRRGTGAPPVVIQAGAVPQGPVPEEPATVYEQQKQQAERALEEAGREGVVRGVVLRLPTVFGDGHRDVHDRGVVAAMIRRALAGEPLTMWHDGTVLRDLIYVHDVARAVLAALEHADELAGGRWPVGAGRSLPLGEVFRAIAATVAAHTDRPPVPVVTVEPPDHAPVTDFRDVVVDNSAFHAVTGWHPRTPFPLALRNTVAALAAHAANG